MEPQQVPQHIDDEDKIIGPISFRQLGILGIGGGISYLAYNSQMPFWFIIIALVAPTTVAFAFLRIAGLTLFQYTLAFISYASKPNTRVWTRFSDDVRRLQRMTDIEHKQLTPVKKKTIKINFKEKIEKTRATLENLEK